MSAVNLRAYIEHLRENQQKATRYEIAFWSKILSPLVAIVMMVLAIPFALQSARAGGVGAKIVLGILIGLSFYFAGRLFSHVGLLNDWPPLVSAGAAARSSSCWWPPRRCAAPKRALAARAARPRARCPASRSCRNWRSRSTSAQANPRPSAASPARRAR